MFILIDCIKIDVNKTRSDHHLRKGETLMKNNGLEDVIAAETRLSDVDGEAGRLVIRGVSLDLLVERATYEDVAALLLDSFLERPVTAADLKARLGQARADVFAHVRAADAALLSLPPVDAMRALIARLPDGEDFETTLRLLAAPAVFLPAVLRLQKGETPVAPTPSLPQSADILAMLNASLPTREQVAALDAYLVTIADHGLNASTFASRVVASTGAGLTSSVLAAISALKGPLHGGAPGPVLDMLDAIGSEENARTWLGQALDRGERLMGFGHRIYRVRDPRADALKGALRPLVMTGQVDRNRIRLAEAVEQAALAILRERKPDRPLDVNVEFYTALLLDALKFPRAAFTGVFAIGRTVGWIAHAREQALEGRLIRPRSVYVGPLPQAA
jgi:citrate synthase